MFGKKLITLLLSLLFIFSIISITQAKSVYVITEHEGNKLTAYDIQADEINYQATATLPASGPVALAIDSNKKYLYLDTNYYIILCQR